MEQIKFGITLILIIITCLVSIGAFNNGRMKDDLIFYPPAINRGQYYRFFSHGSIHADVMHLAFNMIALYSFGSIVEDVFRFDCIFGNKGSIFFLLLYFSALVVSSLPDYLRHRDHFHYRSLGASGAVSAVMLASIVFFPQAEVGFLILPIRIPGYIFAVLYMGLSVYMDRRGGTNIGHSAHFWGAAYGIVFTLVFLRLFASGFDVYYNFMQQIKSKAADLTLICDF